MTIGQTDKQIITEQITFKNLRQSNLHLSYTLKCNESLPVIWSPAITMTLCKGALAGVYLGLRRFTNHIPTSRFFVSVYLPQLS